MKLSVIVPALNEETTIPRALGSVPPDAEIIVVDGGSEDSTVEVASRHGATVVPASRGRAIQMNAGARAATGEVLLFLHADCELDPQAGKAVPEALRSSRIVGGSFRLRVAGPGWGFWLVAFGSNLRARLLRLPYGDQAIFVRRTDFEAVGGYPEIPIMEDVELVRLLRRRGKLVFLRETVTTGTRHWDTLGPLPTTCLNWAAVALYFLGVSPTRLAPMVDCLQKSKRRSEAPAHPAATRRWS